MFQIKDFNSIVLSEINHARSVTDKVTDFQPGSVIRTLMEAPAVEMEELYMQMFLGLREAIPVATFLSFGFGLLPAKVARGFASVSLETPLIAPYVIPLGSVFATTDGRVYRSTEVVTMPIGATSGSVPIAYRSAGQDGNVAAGAITSAAALPAGFTVGNSALDTGRDEETDGEREARFAEFVGSLSRGTVEACMYAVRQSRVLDADGRLTEYVVRAGMNESSGRVRIYLYSSAGIPSAALLADGQARMNGSRNEVTGVVTPGYRAAGVRFDVLAMAERAVPLSIKVGMFTGHALTAAVVQALSDIFASTIRAAAPGQTLYLGELVESLLSVPGVERIVPVSSSNILCDVSEALVPGTLTVAAL